MTYLNKRAECSSGQLKEAWELALNLQEAQTAYTGSP
jgi:hypothetical protein